MKKGLVPALSAVFGLIATLAVLFAYVPQAKATVIHVPTLAYPTIQAGIDAANNGDLVIVTTGWYDERIDLGDKSITVKSTDPDDPDVVANTLIYGDGEPGSIVTFSGGSSVLSGFTVQDGHSDYYGGGVYCQNSSPTITNCIICNNSAPDSGGGIACLYSEVTIANCTISYNSADFGSGGGIYSEESSLNISNCIISNNLAPAGFGGGICYASYSWGNIADCTIEANSCREGGGGIACLESSPFITDCTIGGPTDFFFRQEKYRYRWLRRRDFFRRVLADHQ